MSKRMSRKFDAPSGWKLAIQDANKKIKDLQRSIETFKQHLKDGVPFPQ